MVADVEDVWALERAGIFRGRYHVLGGTLRALDGIGPEELGVDGLLRRVAEQGIGEVILALGATVDGQTTGHYLAERLRPLACTREPAGPWRAGRRRAHLSRRGHARCGAAGPPAGRLTGRPPSPYLTAAFPTWDVPRAMALREILQPPHPLLKAKALPVERIDDALRRLAADMFETMYKAPGIGLAAPQVGVLQRLIVVDVAEGEERRPMALVNPEIVWRSEELATAEEGCLSLPEQFADVTRPAAVRVRFTTEHGEERELPPTACWRAACSTRSTISTASCSSTTCRPCAAT